MPKKHAFRGILRAVSLCLAGGIVLFALFGCNGGTPSPDSTVTETPAGSKEELILSSYRATVATVGGDSYKELTLYTYNGEKVKLNVYTGGDDSEETKESYLVPYAVVDQCYAAIDHYRMREWKSMEDCGGLEGAKFVCKFKDGAGYVRVTSDHMPRNGKEAFTGLESILYEYVREEYRIPE